jgi:peptide/nickel transport system substrate-binding protein
VRIDIRSRLAIIGWVLFLPIQHHRRSKATGSVSRRPYLAAVLLSCLGIFPGCSDSTATPGVRSDLALRVGLPVPARRTPQAIGPRQVVSVITNDSLLRMGRNGHPVARLAQRWEPIDGGKSLDIVLRPGLKFQDGSPITAADVKASLDRSLSTPATESQYGLLRDIERIDDAGDRVRLHLKRPSMLLLENLEVPIRKGGTGERQLTAGAFYVESESPDVTILRSNPFHYAGRPAIGTVHVKTYATVRSAWTSMMRDEVDFLLQVPDEAREFVEDSTGVHVFSFRYNYVSTLVFNVARTPFQSSAVRRALNSAVDRNAVVENVLNGHGLAAQGHVSPDHYAYDTARPPYRFDPATADRLLAEAGYASRRPSGPGEMPSRLHFTCLIAADVAPYDRVAILIQKQLFDLGVDMRIEEVPIERFVQRITTGDFDSALVGLAAGSGMLVPYQFWYSRSGSGFIKTGYTAGDAALEALRDAENDEAFRAAALQFQEVLHDDPPAIFLYWPQMSRAVNRRFDVPDPSRDVLTTMPDWRPRLTPLDAP